MRKITKKLLSLLLAVAPLSATAQFEVVRGLCTPDLDGSTSAAAQVRGIDRHKLSAINTNWDPTKTYRQLVVLVEFADFDFNLDNPNATYDSLFNMPGFNKGQGKGCVADYFRDQSLGILNLQFDVYGPVKVSQQARYEGSGNNYGKDAFREATVKLIAEHPDMDFSVYDWNNNGKVNQVIFVAAGYNGNTSNATYKGYLWPVTTTLDTSVITPDGKTIINYTASAECWPSKSYISTGIGTICHEFSHSLGLPDIYPTSTSNPAFSVCDEWDLMDGGNFTNYGWCPTNYTALERMLMGWIEPVELTDSQTVVDMKPIEEGGEVYRIKHSENEWLLLENRQQRGWDAGAPGKGLCIYHVCYSPTQWSNNKVNNNPDKLRFELIHADNMDYDAWDSYLYELQWTDYANRQRMNSRLLSTSPYPWFTDSTTFVNDALTETSVPAPKMNEPNEAEEELLDKPITNITMSEDGLISFVFLGAEPIVDGLGKQLLWDNDEPAVFDLRGRRVNQTGRGVYIVRDQNGTIRKVFK